MFYVRILKVKVFCSSSHECSEHELKARKKKEELESQAKNHETVLAQVSGIVKRDWPILIRANLFTTHFYFSLADKKEKIKSQKKDYR